MCVDLSRMKNLAYAVSLALVGCVADDVDKTLDVDDGKADGFTTAAGEPIPMQHHVDLAEFDGSPYLLVMIQENGIKAQLDDDYASTYSVASWETVRPRAQSFDTKIVRRIAGSFSTTTGMYDLVSGLDATAFTPANLSSIVYKASPRPRDVYTVAEVIAMSSGAGTLVTIDDRNYFYNYGYKPGTEADDVMSGRSFGASPGRKANDVSDTVYLRELDKLLTTDSDPSIFFRALFEILTRSHIASYANLSVLAQTVATDFIAVYTAEIDRSLMSNLYLHSWENDLAEVTMVSMWGTAVGKVLRDGHIIDGDPTDYWAMSTFSNRSGIGVTRWDRRALQRLITSYERVKHPALIAAIEAITGSSTDVFHRVMTYLNDPRFLDDRDALKRIPGEQLTEAVVALLREVRLDAPDMLTTPAFRDLMQ